MRWLDSDFWASVADASEEARPRLKTGMKCAYLIGCYYRRDKMNRILFHVIALGFALLTSPVALAQDWPTRPVKVVAPVGPGGVTDTMARLTADRLSKSLGAQFFVENHGGGGGSIGTEYAIQSRPDGYTLYFGGGAQFLSAPLIKKLPYDPVTGLTPISMVSINGLGLVVSPSLPVNSISEFIAYVKNNPGKINYGVSGIGQSSHLAAAMLASRETLDMVMIPYQSVPQVLIGLMSGDIQMYFGNISDIIGQVRTNKLKLLGISADHRIAQFPDTPTISETVPNFVFTSWVGYFAPIGTPRPIVEKLAKTISEICRDKEVVDLMKSMGVDSVGSSPEELAVAIRTDQPIAKLAVNAAGLLLK